MRIDYHQFFVRSLCGMALLTLLIPPLALAESPSESDSQPNTAGQAEASTPTQQTEHTRTPRITAEVETQPHSQLSVAERQALSQAAGRILFHVDKARQAVADNEKDQALHHLSRGLLLARIIDKTAPAYQVKATISAGDLVYQDEDTVKMLTIPIYAELGKVSVLAPIEAAKREAAKEGRTSGTPVVQQVELHHTAVSLDVAMAKRSLVTAKAALTNDQPEAADQALRALQATSVTFTYGETNLPVVRARENLTLAQSLVEQQRPEDARFALHEASSALAVYGTQVDGSRAAKVQRLRQKIEELAQTVEQHDHERAAERISRLWDRVAQLVG